MQSGSSNTTFTRKSDFWLALGLLQLCYFLFSLGKCFLLNLTIVNSNDKLHEKMIHGLVRSHSFYFDITSTGLLTNKFSTDFGILDNLLVFVLREAIEGPVSYLIMFAYIFSINYYFMIPVILNLIFLIFFYFYSKKVITTLKELDLRVRTPMFNMVNEMISSLIQIRVFKRRFYLLNEFVKKINASFSCNICYWTVSRAFGANINYVSMILMWIGLVIGIKMATP
jgi:ABC-type multidrug transport system fused ATPase/permease subunit